MQTIEDYEVFPSRASDENTIITQNACIRDKQTGALSYKHESDELTDKLVIYNNGKPYIAYIDFPKDIRLMDNLYIGEINGKGNVSLALEVSKAYG